MTFKKQRNEAVARGVDVVRRRYVCAYVGGQWFSVGETATDRQMGQGDSRWEWSINRGTMER